MGNVDTECASFAAAQIGRSVSLKIWRTMSYTRATWRRLVQAETVATRPPSG